MGVDVQLFKATMAQWASGVTVVTTNLAGERVGITASSFASLSLEPPRVLVCVAKRLYTHHVIEQSQVFAVNILAADQLAWGMRFAGVMPEKEDRFAGIAVETAATGSPLLPGVLGWVDCELRHAYDGGDHTIFVGEVVAAWAIDATREDKLPILYHNRQWRQLAAEVL